jgi:antitoxin Phd
MSVEVVLMTINTNEIVSVSEANQNFSKVTRIAEKNGQAVIFKNNKPKYILIDLENNPIIEMTDDEKIDFVAARILKKYKPAFLELAK